MKIVDYSSGRIGVPSSVEKFSSLWKLDDQKWVQKRREQGRVLADSIWSDESASAIEKNLKYFCEGIYTGYISERTFYFLTPYNSPESARLVFESGMFSALERELIMNEYVLQVHLYGDQMPWLRDHAYFFIEAFMGEAYEEIREIYDGSERVISPAPSFWCRNYIFTSIKFLEDQFNYCGCVDCLPYFISALPFVTHAKHRRRAKLNELMELSEKIGKNQDAAPLAMEFAQNIQANREQIEENWAINSHLD